MTQDDHKALYEELKEVLYDRSKTSDKLSSAQRYFVDAFESAAFGAEFLECYSDLVDSTPDIEVRNLHAFCLGHCIGSRNGKNISLNVDKNYH